MVVCILIGNSINSNGLTQNAQRTGQQIGQQLQNGLNQGLNNNRVLDKADSCKYANHVWK